jgi:hypothetical protein
MFGWILQKNSYEPAVLKTMPPEAPLANVSVVQVGSDFTVAVCCALSLFVHVMVSPTLALIDVGLKAMFAIVPVTVPASDDGAHGASPAAALSEAAGTLSDAAGALAGAAVAGAEAVAPPPHALRIKTIAAPRARIVRDIWTSSSSRAGTSSLGDAGWYAHARRAVS